MSKATAVETATATQKSKFTAEETARLKKLASAWYHETKKRFLAPDEFVLFFMAGVATFSNILLKSFPGKGKTHLAQLTSEFFQVELGRIQGSPGLDETQFMATYDLGKLTKDGIEEPVWRPFMDAMIKHIDEINRVSPHTLNSLFPVLAGEDAYFGTHIRSVEPHIFIATENPGGDGTFRIDDPAFWDRFDICLVNRSLTAREMSSLHFKEGGIREPMPRIGTKEDLLKIRDLIAEMPFAPNAMDYATIAVRATSSCKFGEKEDLKNFPACCKDCELCNGSVICSEVTPLSVRVVNSIGKLAAGLAFLEGKSEVTERHVLMSIPHVVRHRITFVTQSDEVHMSHDLELLVKKMRQQAIDVLDLRKKVGTMSAADIKKFKQAPNPLIKEEMEALLAARQPSEKTVETMTAAELKDLISGGVVDGAELEKAKKYLEAHKVIRVACDTNQLQSPDFWDLFRTPEGVMFTENDGWEHLIFVKESNPQVTMDGVRMHYVNSGTGDGKVVVIVISDAAQADECRAHLATRKYQGDAIELLPVSAEHLPTTYPSKAKK